MRVFLWEVVLKRLKQSTNKLWMVLKNHLHSLNCPLFCWFCHYWLVRFWQVVSWLSVLKFRKLSAKLTITRKILFSFKIHSASYRVVWIRTDVWKTQFFTRHSMKPQKYIQKLICVHWQQHTQMLIRIALTKQEQLMGLLD